MSMMIWPERQEVPTPVPERIIERTKEVPILPERELTAAELDYLTHVADQRHREKIIGAVAGGVVGVGIVAGVGWLVTHMSMS